MEVSEDTRGSESEMDGESALALHIDSEEDDLDRDKGNKKSYQTPAKQGLTINVISPTKKCNKQEERFNSGPNQSLAQEKRNKRLQ